MTSPDASRTHTPGEAAIEGSDPHNGLYSNGRGSRGTLARRTPTSVTGTTSPLNGAGSLREKNDRVPLQEVSHVLLEEVDTAVAEEEGKRAERKEEQEENGIPYDRGWSWMVVLGMFINFLLLAGYIKSSGLFFVELLNKFNAPATHTALFFAIRSGVFSISGYVRDVTGSFTTVFHLIGLGMLVGAGLLCLEGPVRRLESRSQHKAHTPTQDSGPDFELVVNCDSKT